MNNVTTSASVVSLKRKLELDRDSNCVNVRVVMVLHG